MDNGQARLIFSAIVARVPTSLRPYRCKVCMGNSFIVDTEVMPHQPIGSNTVVIGSPSMPLAIVVCSGCGNTQMFNLKVLGLAHETQELRDDINDIGDPAIFADKLDEEIRKGSKDS